MNEKKKAKKERQKQQKIEEIRRKEEEERRKKQAEEAERKRREDEVRKQAEMERQMEKKRKKKEAQRLKKLAAKGGTLPPQDEVVTPPLNPAASTSIMSNAATKLAEAKEALAFAKDPEAALEELRAKHMRELQELQLMHQRQLEEEARRLKLKQPGNGNKGHQPSSKSEAATGAGKSVKRSEALQSKPGTQIKITRTPSGGVEFTTVPANASSQPGGVSQPSFGRPVIQQPPEPARPSVPSKTGAPMVTIRRIETPNAAEPMVTISMAKNGSGNASNNKQVKEDKLLYTLVNGQAMRTPDAPSDLLPNAKLVEGANLSKKQKKKLKQKQNQMQNQMIQQPQHSQSFPMMGGAMPNFTPIPFGTSAHMTPRAPPSSSAAPSASSKPRQPLPLDSNGKVDLDRLQLPPGISITRMSGPTPERKYFPASADEYGSDRDQSVLPLPGTVSSQPQPTSASGGMDYSAMEGLPPGLNGPNVIVVDTSSLKTKEEEEREVCCQSTVWKLQNFLPLRNLRVQFLTGVFHKRVYQLQSAAP